MIGNNIRNLRAKRGVSQDRLSKLSDLSLNTVVKVESGKNPNPTIKTLLKIAKGLNVKVDDLIRVIILVILSACACGRGLAEERVITITEGIRIVLENNRLIKISLSDNEMAYQDSLISRSVLLPHVNLEATKTWLRFQPAAKLGAVVANTQNKDPFAFGFDVYQTLFDFGKSISIYRSSLDAAKASESNTESIRRIATLEFIVAYFNLLEADKMIAVAEKEVESLGSYLNDVSHLYEQGVVVENDLLPAQVRLADAKQKLIAARNQREVAAARLNNILALPLREKFIAQDMEMQPPKFPDMEDAFNTAQAQRPEIGFFKDLIQASLLAERAQAVENFPVLFADAGYAYMQNKYVVHQDNLSFVLGAKVDLYDGGLARALLLKQRTRRQQLNQQKDKLAEDIKFEIEDSFYGLKNASEGVLVAGDALTQAEENVRFNRAKYNAGSATTTEVLEAITLQTRAQTNYYGADYELKRSYAKLMYSMGIDLSLIFEQMEKKNEPTKQ